MSGLLQIVTDFRSQGKYVEAFQALLTSCELDPAIPKLSFRQHFLGNRNKDDGHCLLLKAASAGHSEKLLHAWDKAPLGFASIDGVGLDSNGRLLKLLDARRRVLQATATAGTIAEVVKHLVDAVRIYSTACPQVTSAQSLRQPHIDEPAFLKQLDSRALDAIRQVEADWRCESKRGEIVDWDDPAILIVAESLAYIHNKGILLCEESPIETWVVLKATQIHSQSGRLIEVPEGLLAHLCIERVPSGSGLLYPDCRYSGYLPLDESFQQGLRNAMTTLRRRPDWRNNRGDSFDYRWRLTPYSPADNNQLPALLDSLTGQSAEVAFACAVRASFCNDRIDPRMVISACFESPNAAHERLSPVIGIDEKLLALRTEPSSIDDHLGAKLKLHHVDQLILHGNQTLEESQRSNVKVHDWTVRVLRAGTFDEAYRLLSDYCRVADKVKRYLASRSQTLLEKTCTPYVRSSLAERRQGEVSKGESRDVWNSLSDTATTSILYGELGNRNRVRLLAESGLGKSTLLIESEFLIASSSDSRVPLRLGAGPASISKDDLGRWIRLPLLSDFDWSRDTEDLLDQLAEQLLGDVLVDSIERSNWIREAVSRGEVVFLLDSVDQTDRKVELNKFFNSDGIRRCPAIVSGRPETRQSKSSTWTGIAWHTLWLEPFDISRQLQFWGESPGKRRALENSDCESLCGVPILLQQLKRLAEGGMLETLPNREAIYHRTLEMLVQQWAWRT